MRTRSVVRNSGGCRGSGRFLCQAVSVLYFVLFDFCRDTTEQRKGKITKLPHRYQHGRLEINLLSVTTWIIALEVLTGFLVE